MRRILIIGMGLLVLLVAGHMLAWRWAEQRLNQGFASWTAARRAAGWTVTSGTPVQGGWPLAAELTIPDLFIAGGQPDIPGGLTWSTARVVLGVALLHPRALSIGMEGMQRLRLAEGPDIPFTADRFRATVPLEPGVPARAVDVAVTNLRAGVPGEAAAGETVPHGLTVALMQMHAELKPAAAQGEPAIPFTGSAQDISLPNTPNVAWPLGPRIASLSMEGALNGPLPRGADLVARATAWRDGGGTFEIRRLALGWGPLGLAGSATLALDEQLQPMGAGTAHIIGQDATLDALGAGHTINARTATAAKAVLSLLGRVPEDGGAPEVDVPLTLQASTLAMGRIPLTRVPHLEWPAAP